MRDFLRRVFVTEFLPMSEVRTIKISLVMMFLLAMTAITVPFSFFLDYTLVFKIAVIGALFLFFGIIILLIRFGRQMAAIHFTIWYSILLTLFYTLGSTSLYAYLFFFITLVVIIFYQEIYVYVSYGTIVLLLGLYYTIFHQQGLLLATDIPGSIAVYSVFLGLFYLVFLIQILLNEKVYTDLNYEWVRMNHVMDKYQDHILFYLDQIRKTEKGSAFYEDLDFQRAADELSAFIYEQFKADGRDITNVLDLYLYIHERGLERILEHDEFSIATKKIANRLSKYMLDQRTEMFSMIVNFHTKFRPSQPYKANRYLYDIDSLTELTDEQIIALAMMYRFLAHEIYDIDQWDEMHRVFTTEDLQALFDSPEAEMFFTPGQIGFFKDNQALFEEYLSRKEPK